MLRKILIGAGVLVVAGGAFVADTMIDAGVLRQIEPHFDGACSAVEGVVGVEDITVDRSTGMAYLSAHDRRAWGRDRSHEGSIYMYRVGGKNSPVLMPHDLDQPFFPHGISLWKNPNGPDRMFVISHPTEKRDDEIQVKSVVEVFDVMDGALRHVRTLETDQPYSLNDIAAIDADTFYATIDRGSMTRLGRTLEAYGRLARGGVAFGDASGIRKMAGDLIYPNGIQLSADGSRLYVSETTGERLLAYERDLQTNELAFLSETAIDSGLDNLEWDEEGALWVGAHPRAIDFPAHGQDVAARSPSQILKLTLNEGGVDIEEVYLNDGDPISGSSVGAPFEDRFLIGAVFEPFILDCKRAAVPQVAAAQDTE